MGRWCVFINGGFDAFSLIHAKPFSKETSLKLEITCKEKTAKFKAAARNGPVKWTQKVTTAVPFINQELRIFSFLTTFGFKLDETWKIDGGIYHLKLRINYPVSSPSKLTERYKRSFNEAFGADFIINVEGKQIKASKTVLMGQSEVFRSMLEANMREKRGNEMNINDIRYDVINALIGYLYSEALELKSVRFAMELLAVAEKYLIQELKDKCEQFVVSNLTKEDAFDVFHSALMHNAKKAHKTAAILYAASLP